MSGTPMSFWPLGRGAARARRSVPGRELDARSRNGAVDHRGQSGAALQYRRWWGTLNMSAVSSMVIGG
jgi:hypothetical protein